MKALFTALAALLLLPWHVAAAEESPPLELGVYRGYVSIVRTVPAYKIRDVTTFIITGEVYNEPNDPRPWMQWTLRNISPEQRLMNRWARTALDYADFSEHIYDLTLHGGETWLLIPGGTPLPSSLVMSGKKVAWKCQKTDTATNGKTKVHYVTTFSFSKYGPPPADDP